MTPAVFAPYAAVAAPIAAIVIPVALGFVVLMLWLAKGRP